MTNDLYKVPTIADMVAKGEFPDVLFWVGCAGAFDDKYKKVIKSLVKILNKANVSFAVLGPEETCTGDPARRAGNEFLFQMQAQSNIQVLNGYGVKKIVASCPHCFNTLKNEYPDLGGKYEVTHHTELLQSLIDEGKLSLEGGHFKGKKIAYHDSCYLGRANEVYEAPRKTLASIDTNLVEMKRNKRTGLCCGAGGSQMFKEPEKGDKTINVERTEEALSTGADVVATGCPFCKIMLTDGMKAKNREEVQVMDITEVIAKEEGL
ncbi:Fe-S oxidoreductase [Fulvitalea axinellae]|uniref:Fe-S oxidoreductase n=1 Tax=Fulvitalea axinellae TaxID=1182444 RepID=A0AAU9CVF7_9BACT|nr:Fe-S oxidoreductase [Fulvitalea axinellae]